MIFGTGLGKWVIVCSRLTAYVVGGFFLRCFQTASKNPKVAVREIMAHESGVSLCHKTRKITLLSCYKKLFYL